MNEEKSFENLNYAKDKSIAQDRGEDFARRIQESIQQREKNGRWEGFEKEVYRLRAEVGSEWEGEALEPLLDRLHSIASYTINPYPLGEIFQRLNEEDYYLIRDGLITIGAEANAGKSSLLTCLSLELLQQNPQMCFLFYSLDDSDHLSGKRLLCQLEKRNLFKEKLIPDALHQEKKDILKRIAIKTQLNIDTVTWDVQKMKEIVGCKQIIIGVDYLQIIPNSTDKLQREFLNDTVKSFKEIQKELEADGCILFLLSQFNRDTKSTTYRYRETSEIENQSDVCLELFSKSQGREDSTTEGARVNEDPSRIIRVTKNKLGMKGKSWETEISTHGDFNFSPLSDQGYKGKQKKQHVSRSKFYWEDYGENRR